MKKPKIKRIVKAKTDLTENDRPVLAFTIAESIYLDMTNRYDIETDDGFKDPDYVKGIWTSIIEGILSGLKENRKATFGTLSEKDFEEARDKILDKDKHHNSCSTVGTLSKEEKERIEGMSVKIVNYWKQKSK